MKIFSIPLNPKLNESQIQNFTAFCQEYRDYIYDIYFTCRVAPFLQDAMGDVFIQTEDNLVAIDNAIAVSDLTGIPLSATFNNIEVRPSQRNLDIWIRNFRPLYERGVRSVTIPHTHWVMTGQIQSEFPELFIKNTILRNVREPNEVANLARAGFHYVNLDRDLMRDHDRLREIQRVKNKYNIKLSLLANEGCLGACPVMDEHFEFNNTRTDGAQYFNDPISRVSCPKWDYTDHAIPLKTANFPPWRQDWLEFLDLGIDVFKMHGRESIDRLWETFDLVKRFARGDEILFDNFNDYLRETNLEHKPIKIWRDKIKTCRFDCWDCNYCDRVWLARGNNINKKAAAVAQAVTDSVNVRLTSRVEGITSDRCRQLLNQLGQLSTAYLEVGVLNGGTFCSVLEGNQLQAHAVDNWQQDTQAANGSTDIRASKKTFVENAKAHKGRNSIKVFDCDFSAVDLDEIDYIDFMFYDADHDPDVTAQAVRYFAEKFENETILVFDDANFDGVISGAVRGIAESGFEIVYQKIILNEIEDPDQWWNGVFVTLIRRK